MKLVGTFFKSWCQISFNECRFLSCVYTQPLRWCRKQSCELWSEFLRHSFLIGWSIERRGNLGLASFAVPQIVPSDLAPK